MARLSQVFLSPEFSDRVAEAVDPKEGDVFLEVGPGRGQITTRLLEAGATVHGVEIDPILVRELERRFNLVLGRRFFIYREDYLRFNPFSLSPRPTRFFSSLPYHITSGAIGKLVGERGLYRDIHIIVQNEVAKRLSAKPGEGAWGALSVRVQAVFRVEVLFGIPPWAFTPRPRVASALVRLSPLPISPEASSPLLGRLLERGFKNRRKKLRNALGIPEWAIERVGLSPDIRPDQLGVKEWLGLVRALLSPPHRDQDSDNQHEDRINEAAN